MLLAALLFALQTAAPSPPSPLHTAPQPAARRQWPTQEADYHVLNFRFRDGSVLPDLRIHYTTLGTPHRDAAGRIDNAVTVLHGTGGSGHQFLAPQFADPLYGPGAPLDIRRYWIILPDGIGHGRSSKPSDGLHMRFPHYTYDDMVDAQYRLFHDGLGIARMRLVMGTSMGCMQGLMWGEAHPNYMAALMPMACEPIALAGLNRMWRQLLIDGIKADPAWAGGEYKAEPMQGLRTAESLLLIAGSAPLNFQKNFPDRDKAAAFAEKRVTDGLADVDANDLLYQVDASRTYDPSAGLERITAPTVWINSADDFINPRNLAAPQEAVKRMKDARFRLIPESADTHGHGTHTWAVFWKDDLAELMARTEPGG
jgi:homoserine O-acetyltransferase